MQEAKAVYQAENAEQAKERLAGWSRRWDEVAPKSVATFERDFDATIAYYQLGGVALQWVRSTSLGEELVAIANSICPYSNATRGNIPVKLVLEKLSPTAESQAVMDVNGHQ